MSQRPIRFVQISDTHFFADENSKLLSVPTHQSFDAVLAAIKKYADEHPIDFIIHSGDLSQDHTAESYDLLAQRLHRLEVPVYFVPGNHDNASMMETVLPRETITNNKHILSDNWQIILLSSQKEDAVEGELDDGQLAFMQTCLKKHPDHQAIILFHHHPLPVRCAWLDNIGLQNADEFWSRLTPHSNVNTVLFGHVHQDIEGIKHGIKCYSTPSTCFQFMRNQNEFGIENLPPGFRWVELSEAGQLNTGVIRTPAYIGEYEAGAKGY
mgnify:CR=1 FL=1